MITHRIWNCSRRNHINRFKSRPWAKYDTVVREGWFLFGIFPIYIQDREVKFGET